MWCFLFTIIFYILVDMVIILGIVTIKQLNSNMESRFKIWDICVYLNEYLK